MGSTAARDWSHQGPPAACQQLPAAQRQRVGVEPSALQGAREDGHLWGYGEVVEWVAIPLQPLTIVDDMMN